MPDDSRTVPVTFQLDPQTAAALADPATRGHVEQVIQSTVRKAGIDRLFAAMDALSAEAARRGLTDEILEEELAAYNAEHRERRPAG
jgi:hypothetical protein